MRRIFISHSSRDNGAAEALKVRLQAHGYKSVFLDFDPVDGIPAGRDWERELYQRIRSCQVMIVVCSRDSMSSRWCFMEITHARALGKPLLALKIDDCELDGVLSDSQAVDLTRDGEEAYVRLLGGIVAAGLDPAKTFAWDASRPPYPGLLAFQEEDAGIFFGRSDEIAQGLELLNRVHHLGEPRVVMVLGASGTGKSSLVRAGVVPRLRRDSGRWTVVGPFRPRADPARELAAVLSDSGWPELGERVHRRGDRNALAEVLLALQRKAANPAANVLLVIDQFEELLGSGDAPHFLTQLRRAVDHPDAPVVVLATMRSDFLDRFQSSPPLIDLPYEVLSLGPMSESDVAEVVEEPAKEVEVEFEPRLVAALVADAGTSNALPLLAFTLRELWERYAGDGRLTLEEYRVELGGVQEVVGRAADDVLRAASVTREQERALRTAFLAMLRITDDGRYARRPVKWNDLPAPAHPLLERFITARLLVSGVDGAERTVEVAHERLFESWKQLRGWIAENAEALRLREEIDAAARAWEGPRDADQLWRGARVSRARELLAEGTLLLDDRGRRFIDASEHGEKARRRRIIRAVSSFAVFAAVLAAVALVFAMRARTNAVLAEERARTSEVQRLRALSAQSFAESQRVRTRASAPGIDRDAQRALQAIAPKYLDQARRYERAAIALQESPDDWRRRQDAARAAPDALFTFEALRAQRGNAFLVHYGAPGAPRHILIDGGPPGTYRKVLQSRLRALRHGGKPVALRLVVATQTDDPAVAGLRDLFRDLQTQPAAAPTVAIGAFWSNAFIPGPPEVVSSLGGRDAKTRMVADARALGVPVNAPFTSMVAAPEAGAARVHLGEELSITVLSPDIQWLREFAVFWLDRWRKLLTRQHADPAVASGYDVVETFADSLIELLPSPMESDSLNARRRLERTLRDTPANLASMVLMLEMNGRRILLPSDARGDIVLSALERAGYTDSRGNVEVDVLVLPHGGSELAVTEEFFRRVKARYYVISSDGRFRNPKVETFTMLFRARHGDPRTFSIALTYPPQEYGQDYPLRALCVLLARERSLGTPFEIITPGPMQNSFGIDLASSAAFVDKGVRNGVCGL
jgi:hypothetical protein